jgi:LytS/YehU family sensor histidine kinase
MPSLSKFLKENLYTILGLIIGSLVVSWFIRRSCCEGIDAYFWISFFTASLWLALWLGNAYLSRAMDYLISWQKEPVKRLIVGLIGMTVYSLGAVYIIVLLFKHGIGFNVGDIDGMFISTLVITLIITMFMTGRLFLVNWRQSAINAERLEKESVTAQYESLKNQVNPHFLFNSLNALTNLVYEDPDKAAKFIKQLSEVYRYVLDSRSKELVSITEELTFLQSYLFLQQIRFGDKLKMVVDLPNPIGQVAPLALQLLIENAIKHNIIATDLPLTIQVYQQEGFFVVENNLQKKTVLSEDSSGLGLDNITKRYNFLSSVKVKVEESSSKFKVSIPVIS